MSIMSSHQARPAVVYSTSPVTSALMLSIPHLTKTTGVVSNCRAPSSYTPPPLFDTYETFTCFSHLKKCLRLRASNLLSHFIVFIAGPEVAMVRGSGITLIVKEQQDGDGSLSEQHFYQQHTLPASHSHVTELTNKKLPGELYLVVYIHLIGGRLRLWV